MTRNFSRMQVRRMLLTTGIGVISTMLFVMADTVFAGHLLGESAIAGVNVIYPLAELVLFAATTLSCAIAIPRAMAVGRCDRRIMDLCCSTGVWTAVLLSVVLMTPFLFCGIYFGLVGIQGAAREVAQSYCGTYWSVAAIAPWFFLGSNLLCTEGAHRHCRIAMVVNAILKLTLSAPLCKSFGAAGLPLATAIGMAAATAVMADFLRSDRSTLTFSAGLSFTVLRDGLRYAFLEQLYVFGDMLRALAVNMFVVRRLGEGLLPVVSAFTSVQLLSYVMFAIVCAVQPVLESYVGEGNLMKVRDVGRYGAELTAGTGFLLAVTVFCCPDLLVSFVGISDPAIAAPARTAVRIGSVFLTFILLCGYVESFYTYVQRFAISFATTSLETCIVPIPLGIALGLWFGAPGLWLGMSIAPAAVLVLVLAFVIRRYGNPYALPKERGDWLTLDLEAAERPISELSATVAQELKRRGLTTGNALVAPTVLEDALMSIRKHNSGHRVFAEVALHFTNPSGITIIIKDNGRRFDITDADANVSSLRDYLIALIMSGMRNRLNLLTLGVNRNCFSF